MALSHNTLRNYYEVNFSLMHYHKWSLAEVENLLPWERELYVNMLIDALKESSTTTGEQQIIGSDWNDSWTA